MPELRIRVSRRFYALTLAMLTVYYMPYSLLVTEHAYMTRHDVLMTENISPRHPGYFNIDGKGTKKNTAVTLQLVRHHCLEYSRLPRDRDGFWTCSHTARYCLYPIKVLEPIVIFISIMFPSIKIY